VVGQWRQGLANAHLGQRRVRQPLQRLCTVLLRHFDGLLLEPPHQRGRLYLLGALFDHVGQRAPPAFPPLPWLDEDINVGERIGKLARGHAEAEFEPTAGFDTILATECIYTGIESGEAVVGGEQWEVWRALVETICALARPHTTVFICSKERGMQLHDHSDDEEVGQGSRPEPAAEGGGGEGAEGATSGSLVVDFTQHMEWECGFGVEVLGRPPEGEQRLGGLWLLRMQRRASDQEEPEPET
jgi:hypothetical protein